MIVWSDPSGYRALGVVATAGSAGLSAQLGTYAPYAALRNGPTSAADGRSARPMYEQPITTRSPVIRCRSASMSRSSSSVASRSDRRVSGFFVAHKVDCRNAP
jgi:hypothetical protein